MDIAYIIKPVEITFRSLTGTTSRTPDIKCTDATFYQHIFYMLCVMNTQLQPTGGFHR